MVEIYQNIGISFEQTGGTLKVQSYNQSAGIYYFTY